MIELLIWLILILLVLYLGVGLGIYAIGTRNPKGENSRLFRSANERLVFKDETLQVDLKASNLQLPALEEKKVPWDVVLVIDRSVSMRSASALNHAKEAAKNLISSTPVDFSYGIVEFQAYARICAQFTGDHQKLHLAIDKIVSNGGTAIDEGLKLAHQLFKQQEISDKKKAVILLSDGGSNEKLALKQANALKDGGIVTYTIGLGHCHQDLMRKIAGDDSRFFYASEPSQLKEFFFAVGRKIQKNYASEVQITEFPAVSTLPFRISGWGDLRPLDIELFKTQKPYVKWFLTGIHQDSTRVRYRLIPRCCGWYPIAAHRAELSLKNDNKEDTFTSNHGPYVLVIPRFFLWQIFWVFLNPLYWIIKERVLKTNTCIQSIKTMTLKKYDKPEPMPRVTIEPLPPIEPIYSLNLNPTLVIGIGSGGIHALTHFKRLLWEHNQDEKINQKVALVAVDSIKPYFNETVSSGTVQLAPADRKHLYSHTNKYIREQSEKSQLQKEHCWLPAKELNARGTDCDTGKGTFMNPQMGRLIYLLTRENMNELNPILKRLYDSAPDETLNICLVGTMGGGTSTGMMLDIIYSVKILIKKLNIPQKSISLFLMDAQPDDDETDREIKQETYTMNKKAFTMELGRFFAARDTAFSPLPGDEKIDQWFDHIFFIEKKQAANNKDDLYPQAAVLLYQWVVENGFREFILKNSTYVSNQLLAHHVEADVLFFYKRLMEEYFALRLLLTVIGNRMLGLGENPVDYSIKSAEIDHSQVDQVIDILLNKEEWTTARPLLFCHPHLIKNPDGNHLSRFLSLGGMAGIVENTTTQQQDQYINNETRAFEHLTFAWLEFLLNPHKDSTGQPLKEKKLPVVYQALLKLKANLHTIKDLAESISPGESLLDRKQCLVLSRLCHGFSDHIDNWLPAFVHWFVVLGEGTKEAIGVSRKLNDRLNAVEKAIQSSQQFITTPYFKFNTRVKDLLYQKYFLNLETEILKQLHWLVESTGKIKLYVAARQLIKEYGFDTNDVTIDGILEQLISLPGYFASQRNQWNHMTINDYIQLGKEAGQDMIKDYTYPRLKETSQQDLLFLDQSSYDTLENEIHTGLVHQKIESLNPFIHGFFKYRLNERELKGGSNIDFDSLPPFVFAEEWNCYNALITYRQVTRKEAQVPPFELVALCRHMKKFLGAVKLGIIDNKIESIQKGTQMVYRLDNLVEIPQTQDKEKDILKLIRLVTESSESNVIQTLEESFKQAINIAVDSMEELIFQTKVPLSKNLKTHIYQITFGGVEYYKHIES